MTQVTETNQASTATEATEATTVAAPAVAVEKAPSKKSQALAIFDAAMAKRAAGGFDSNKAFRAAVLASIQADLQVSLASAATMYNAAKKEAEAADATVALGRDPKKEKAPSTGRRGRPQGSKNKTKDAGEAAPVVQVNVPEATEATEASGAADFEEALV